jgi:hypothetical protein
MHVCNVVVFANMSFSEGWWCKRYLDQCSDFFLASAKIWRKKLQLLIEIQLLISRWINSGQIVILAPSGLLTIGWPKTDFKLQNQKFLWPLTDMNKGLPGPVRQSLQFNFTWHVRLNHQGSIVWSQFSAIFDNFRQKNGVFLKNQCYEQIFA